jgi:hypothetical protein
MKKMMKMSEDVKTVKLGQEEIEVRDAIPIFYDGSFRYPRETYYYSEENDLLFCISQNEDFGQNVASLAEAFKQLFEWKGAKHPGRLCRKLADTDIDVVDVDDAYPVEKMPLKDKKFWLVNKYDDSDYPKAILFEDDCELIAYQDCTRGTDDHDRIYAIKSGPYAGKFLTHYASRWQGSPDYVATLYENTDEIPHFKTYLKA